MRRKRFVTKEILYINLHFNSSYTYLAIITDVENVLEKLVSGADRTYKFILTRQKALINKLRPWVKFSAIANHCSNVILPLIKINPNKVLTQKICQSQRKHINYKIKHYIKHHININYTQYILF